MAQNYEPLFSWKKLLSWKTVLVFIVIIGGFSIGYYSQTFFGSQPRTYEAVTASGQPVADQNEDPYIIDFSHQGLLEFPAFLLEREQITDLILSNNSITSIPSAISAVTSLRVLDMRYNSLSGALPAAVASLGLVDVNLARNQLESVPEEVGQMSSLRYFDISHNRLTSIPDSITGLQDLKWLNLEGNDIDEAEIDELRQQMPSTIINY